MVDLLPTLRAFSSYPFLAFIIGFLFASPVLLQRLRCTPKQGRGEFWLLLAAIVWAVFGCYKVVLPGAGFLLLLDAWVVLPGLIVISLNALIMFAFDRWARPAGRP